MIVIEGYGYRVGVSAEQGGTILFAEGTVGGRSLPIFVPLETPEVSKNGGCFVMAPFTNRIVGGRFTFDGQDHVFPMNRPAQDVAIHGFSRDRAWRVAAQTSERVILEDDVRQEGVPWSYAIRQEIAVTEGGLEVTLALRNLGPDRLPFGLGLHPWFPRRDRTVLTLPAEGRFSLDDRALPCLPFRPQTPDERHRSAEDWIGVDEAMVDADAATIVWPDQGARLEMSASGAFRHMHLFVPAAREVFCIEPVSHLPDAVNRPEVARKGAMTPLAPNETMQGTATFRLHDI
ncbi:hypothetical protein [Falsirhodobacter halotolerans]|uniref:aldose epimerase family protein n=1 Tax=Falsirhodobacter halotolerans TaxID=1146892 RepID=UPI001FD19319|nr:hypothetical protein [Falsirhodobacter halotolerans]MCJ8141284.1 hypothetical protein [Falsirhodobacter halotolerans]